ncbi:MAG: hypothetical protein FJX47_05460 [Alphaproteobacteria bacterium]|nr:hypothetical protein [Alphaproteobacteria bacterium]
MTKSNGASALGAMLVLCLGATVAQAQGVKVGVVQGLSGPPAVVDYGESYLQGIELALDDYLKASPKHKVELVVYNDEANPQKAVAFVQRLISNDRVSAVIGTVNSGNVAAFAPLLQEAKIPLMIGPAVATNLTLQFIDKKPSFIFRCALVEKYQLDKMLDWAIAGKKKIGLLHGTSGYGQFVAAEVQKGIAERNTQLVGVESAAPNVTDMTPQVLKLKESGADLVLLFHESPELFYRALPKAGYRPTVAGTAALSAAAMLRIVGKEGMEGTVMGDSLDLNQTQAKEVDQKLRAKFGEKYRWPAVAALGHDAMKLILGAVDASGGGNAEKIRDALEQTKGFKGATGAPAVPYSPNDHECLDPGDVFLSVWRDGRTVKLQ